MPRYTHSTIVAITVLVLSVLVLSNGCRSSSTVESNAVATEPTKNGEEGLGAEFCGTGDILRAHAIDDIAILLKSTTEICLSACETLRRPGITDRERHEAEQTLRMAGDALGLVKTLIEGVVGEEPDPEPLPPGTE